MQNLQSLTLKQFRVDDQALEAIAKFKQLSTLNLQNWSTALSDVSDQGVMRLKNMECVRQLDLSGEGITDASTPTLATLTNLQNLGLLQTSITDDGLRDIGSLKMLQSLSVSSPTLTDKCLLHLTGMRNLRVLSLPGPPLSPELLAIRNALWKELNGDVPLVQTGISADATKRFKEGSPRTLTLRLH